MDIFNWESKEICQILKNFEDAEINKSYLHFVHKYEGCLWKFREHFLQNGNYASQCLVYNQELYNAHSYTFM